MNLRNRRLSGVDRWAISPDPDIASLLRRVADDEGQKFGQARTKDRQCADARAQPPVHNVLSACWEWIVYRSARTFIGHLLDTARSESVTN